MWPIALFTLCVEGTQPRDKCAWIAAAVRVVLPYERSATSSVSLILVHLRCPTMRSVAVTVEDVIDGHVDRDIPQPGLVTESGRYVALDFTSDFLSRLAVADRDG